MDLVPVKEPTGGQTPEARGAEAAHEGNHPEGALFTVSPERQQLIGVQFTEVTSRRLEKTIRTVGRIELDETKIAVIQTKISGWIERVFVDFTWQHVKRGDPLFTIYSPELVSTQEEYLLALKARDTLIKSSFPDVSRGAGSLLEATRKRLLLWDITPEQIEELERTGQVRRTLTIHSPIEGHVAVKNAFENMRVEPNTHLYTIADHGRVWVHADIYENEISLVKVGQEVEMALSAFPGKAFKGTITYIWPHLDAATRTLKVRMEFPNPDLTLKPEMYADVHLRVPVSQSLVVPDTAVIRTGTRNIVFVDRGHGQLELRDVKLGMKVESSYQVLDGLKEGERVITAANFLIDAESKLQGITSTWGGAGHAH